VPPLRDRREDIPLLTEHLLARHRLERTLTFASSALDALVTYDWPGNVRQLERVLERTVALTAGPIVVCRDLPDEITKSFEEVLTAPSGEGDHSLRAWSSRYVRLILERCQGNKRRACELLDISFHTLNGHLRYQPIRSALEGSEAGDDAGGPVRVEALDGMA